MINTPTNITVKPRLCLCFNEAAWTRPATKDATNCYSYALGDPRLGWTYPGHLREIFRSFGPVPVYDLHERLLRDGLLPVAADEANPQRTHLIAAFREGNITGDFHFLRYNHCGEFKGLWSHKMGSGLPSGSDYYGRPINDPAKAKIGNYSMIGLYALPATGVPSLQRHYPQFS